KKVRAGSSKRNRPIFFFGAKIIIARSFRKDQNMSEKNAIRMVKELAELYQKRDAINTRIGILHRELDTLDEEPRKKRSRRPRGFQRPSWDVLELVPQEGGATIQEIWQKSQRYYGARYTYTAVVCSLRRLARGNLLSYDKATYTYTRTEEGKRALNPYTGKLSGTQFSRQRRK